MIASDLVLNVFALQPGRPPSGTLENRVGQLFDREATSESLDSAAFSLVNGSHVKADYLANSRAFVIEMKTINTNSKDGVTRRLRDRFRQPGSPKIMGQLGMERILEALTDGDSVLKMMADISARAVRRHLQKSNSQIAATKLQFGIENAAGLVVILNEAEKIVDAAIIAYGIRSAFETAPAGFPAISHIWVSVEAHKIRAPGGALGFPQLIILGRQSTEAERLFVGAMLDNWALQNDSTLLHVPHDGTFTALRPVYPDGPPVLDLS